MLKKLYNYRLAWIFHPHATRIIKSWNLDIIHVQTEGGVGLYGRLLPRTFKIPLIYTYHTMYVDYTYYVTKGIMYGVPTYEECVLKEKMLHCKWLAVFCKYYRVDEEKIKI